MLSELLSKANKRTPLEVSTASWNGVVLHLAGDGWNFSLNGAWRALESNTLIMGCDDSGASDWVEDLIGGRITEVTATLLDPTFVMSSGISLEIFSTSIGETWTMRLPDSEVTFVAVPSDSSHSD